jgi:hypothetical protein
MHDPEDEPEFAAKIDFDFENDTALDLDKLKRLILKYICV